MGTEKSSTRPAGVSSSGERRKRVAPHLDVQKMFETYRDLLRLRSSLADRFHDKIGERMKSILDDRDPWEMFTPQKMLADGDVRGMLVYDQNDPEVEQAQFDEIVQYWKNCTQRVTNGLGHNRILKDRPVVDAVVDYLNS
jgi:hypothetical protein